MKLTPMANKVIAKPADNSEQTTKGGIIIPEIAKEKPQEGIIVAIGNELSINVEIGDYILYPKYGNTEITHEDTEYVILNTDNILAKITERNRHIEYPTTQGDAP